MTSDRTVVTNPSAPVGKSLKYAHPERERRYLLDGPPAGDVVQTAAITDRYLDGTRLRIRMTVEQIGDKSRTVYKLTQKVPKPSGGPGLITTVYLSDAEHEALCAVPSRVLRKTRLSIPPFGVDVFQGPLDGLVIAEVEFETDEDMEAFVVPISTVAEVTEDVRFTGGRLVDATREELARDLAGLGIQLSGA